MIYFAKMERCGYCVKAAKELEQEIKDGTVKIIDSKDSAELKKYFKSELRGFPAFVNTENGLETTGFGSKKDLFGKLKYEIKENYTPSKHTTQTQPNGYNPMNPYGYNPFAYNPYSTQVVNVLQNISGCNNNNIYFSKRKENPKEVGVL